jgi:O-antigen ligase
MLAQCFAASAAFALPALAGGLALAAARGQVRLQNAADPVESAFFLLLLTWLGAALLGADPGHSLALSVPLVCAVLALLALRRAVPDRGRPRALAAAILGCGALQSLQVVVAAADSGPGAGVVAAADVPWLVVPNDLAWIACSWMLLPRCWRAARGRTVQLVLLLVVALGLAAMWLVHSRLALGCALLVLCACAVQRGWRAATRRGAILVLCALAIIAIVAAANGWQKGFASMHARLELWSAAWRIGLAHPWLGVGPQGFGAAIEADLPAAQRLDPRGMPWPHSLPLELLATMGWAGVLAFALLLWRIVRDYQQASIPYLHANLCAVVLVGALEASMLRTWMWWGLALVAAWPCLARCRNSRSQGSNE